MVQRTYSSTMQNAVAFFESLRPARAAIQAEQSRFRPFGPHYHMLGVIIAGLDVAAEFFTKRRSFYSSASPDMIGRTSGPMPEPSAMIAERPPS